MAITEVPTKFAASDGKEFKTKEEAERHDKLVTAKKELDEARNRWGYALAQTQQTADGKPFDWQRSDYYFITEGWAGMPAIEKVWFYFWNCTIHQNDTVSITQERNGRETEYHIGNLYSDEWSASRALLAKQEAWLIEQTAKVEKLRKQVTPTR